MLSFGIMSAVNINWNDVLKKEARGIDDYDLGEIQEIGTSHVVSKKGTLDYDKFYLSKESAMHFDGHTVWFKITKEEAQTMTRDGNR
jgi:hypothetical protein